ncbi:MAG: protein-L-isoaspartate(D-aspartate) O-methyltransferase [Candidatus Micrarchaeota archaeon]
MSAAKGLLAMVRYLRYTAYLTDERVARAMLKIDRALFVPRAYQDQAYSPDQAFPLGSGQVITAADVVASMLSHLDVRPGMKVLEIGTGSGYAAALLSELVGRKGRVITMELIPELAALAESNLSKLPKPKTNMTIVVGDGSEGYSEGAPYDRILVTAGMPSLDLGHPLLAQLAGDGKLVAPVGGYHSQDLVLYDNKTGKSESFLPVCFVPLVGKGGWE